MEDKTEIMFDEQVYENTVFENCVIHINELI